MGVLRKNLNDRKTTQEEERCFYVDRFVLKHVGNFGGTLLLGLIVHEL